MRAMVLVTTLLVVACERGSEGFVPIDAPPIVLNRVTSPPGFYHLPNGTVATTLYLQPGGVARFWFEECDSIGLWETQWHSTSTSTVEVLGSSTSVLTFQDGGTALAEPPLLPDRRPPPEIWQPGAVCSVCLPGQPMAVVGCPTPDAGVLAWCCSGGCGGGAPVAPTCKLGLVAGEPANAIAAGKCTCPSGSVSAAECSGYPKVFCGGL